MNQLKVQLITLCTSGLLLTACGNSSTSGTASSLSDSQANTSQSAVAQANSDASASESSGNVGFADEFAEGERNLTSACSFSSARSSCASSGDTIAWNGCTIDAGRATLTGGYTEAFSGTSSSTCTVPIVSGETVVRTSTGSTITMASGASITTDTNGGTAWDGTVIPATGSSIVNSSGTRSITVNGTHRVLKRASGVTLYDHLIKTTTPLSVSGTRAGGNRNIASGVMVLYHNLAKYTATTTFNNVTWGDSTCCYPTSGSITSVFSGTGATGNTSMTFSLTCGQATHVDTAGNSTLVTLDECH